MLLGKQLGRGRARLGRRIGPGKGGGSTPPPSNAPRGTATLPGRRISRCSLRDVSFFWKYAMCTDAEGLPNTHDWCPLEAQLQWEYVARPRGERSDRRSPHFEVRALHRSHRNHYKDLCEDIDPEKCTVSGHRWPSAAIPGTHTAPQVTDAIGWRSAGLNCRSKQTGHHTDLGHHMRETGSNGAVKAARKDVTVELWSQGMRFWHLQSG